MIQISAMLIGPFGSSQQGPELYFIIYLKYHTIVKIDFENKNKCKFYVNFCSLDLTKS